MRSTGKDLLVGVVVEVGVEAVAEVRLHHDESPILAQDAAELTQDEDDEFSDWLSMKIKGGNL